MNETYLIYFRNKAQAAIFNHELRGQISDGHWENSKPMNHWKAWSSARGRVAGPANDYRKGRNFYAVKENYNFSAPDLLDVVALRMRVYAVLAAFIGLSDETITHLDCMIDCDRGFTPAIPGYVREYASKEQTPGMYTKRLEALEALDLAQIAADLARGLIRYDIRALKWDLNDMKEIVRIRDYYVAETREEREARVAKEKRESEVWAFERGMMLANHDLADSMKNEHFLNEAYMDMMLPPFDLIQASNRQLAEAALNIHTDALPKEG